MRRTLALVIPAALTCLIYAASGVYGVDDTPAGAGLHLRVTPLTRGVVPNGRFVVRFSVNYSGPGRSGDIYLSFVAVDGRSRALRPKIKAAGLRLKRSYVSGATSMLVDGVSSRVSRIVRATFTLRAEGKICVRSTRAWLVENPSDFKARAGSFCNYVIRHG